MQIKKLMLSGVLLLVSASAFGGESRTTYRISRTGATVTTAVANPTAVQAKILESYLFDELVANFKSFQGIKSVKLAAAGKGPQKVEDQEDSTEYTRNYPVQISFELPEKVTLTFTVEETFRKCKAGYACTPSAFLKMTSGSQQDISIDVQRLDQEHLSIVSNYNLSLPGKAPHDRNTVMIAAARALRVSNEKLVQ